MKNFKCRAWDKHNRQMCTHVEIYQYEDGSVGVHGEHCGRSSDDFELLLWTGLKDQNGVEIYEGDIVTGVVSSDPAHVCEGLKLEGKLGQQVVGCINYGALYAQFYFTTNGITYLDLCLGLRDIHVIGNIYQNPELLEPNNA